MDLYKLQSNFVKGELSPRLHSRADHDVYRAGVASAENMQVMVQGGMRKRSGTRYVSTSLVDNSDPRFTDSILIPFIFSQTQSYVLEFSGPFIVFYTNAGEVKKNGVPYVIFTEYTSDQLRDINYVQSADVLYIFHPDHPTKKIIRYSETDWRQEDAEFNEGPWQEPHLGSNSLRAYQRPTPPNTFTTTAWGGGQFGILDMFKGDWMQWDWATPQIVDGLILTNNTKQFDEGRYRTSDDFAFRGWKFQGWDHVLGIWVTLDTRSGEIGWQQGEERVFPWYSDKKFVAHRLMVESAGGGGGALSTWGLRFKKYAGMTVGFSSLDGINGGTGFTANDIGRLIRWRDNTGYHSTLKITARNSNKVVTGEFHGFQQTGGAAEWSGEQWQLGSFGKTPGYPQTGTIFQERLCVAGTREQPRSVFMSATNSYNNFEIPDDIVDDSPITVTMSGARQDRIAWLKEVADQLIVGTTDSISSVSGTNNEPITPTSLVIRAQTWDGSSEHVVPVTSNRSVFFVADHNKGIRELSYTDLTGSFDAPAITQVAEHLYVDGIRGMSVMHDLDHIIAAYDDLGQMSALTHETAQNVSGACPWNVGGDDVMITALASIPEDFEGVSSENFYAVVKRTIGGQTRSYVERFEPAWTIARDERDMWFLDSAIRYDGPEVTVITGLEHLNGQQVMAVGWNDNGPVISTDPTETSDIYTVVDGQINLGYGVTRALVGIPYRAGVQLLPLALNLRDGSSFGRQQRANAAIVDLLSSRAVLLQSAVPGLPDEEVVLRRDGQNMDQYIPLFTGPKKIYMEDSYETGGAQIKIFSEQPHPLFIRSITPVVDTEGAK